MLNLMRRALARLRARRHPAALALPKPPGHHAPQRPPHHPESPLDGDASRLVRPYLLAHEQQQARRERAFLREMAVTS
ncbi:hypothetical protein [Streptomyces endophytica]|uniref:Uncharacterized protein n=1 Tax=Streptomyces endophytica TaxID=2991496 RepID=A0ABY6P945_9ACTN|nr:hypothetical protein [Streptomyces endophytica]UZJ30339.1 hypothetical protein OJ254_08060 [Streptomyces endophytica]